MCINYSKSYNYLTYFKSDVQGILKNTSKTWHLYIKMFMYRYFKNQQSKKVIFSTEIFHVYGYSSIFLELRDKSLNTMDVLKCKSPHVINVIWASGNIYIFSSISYKLSPNNYYFYFDVNFKIRINMTFVVLHLGIPVENCNYDYLEVNSSESTKGNYTYCGYYSNLNLYPEFNSFTLTITLSLIMQFHLHTIFSVTDKMFIYNPVDFKTSWRTFDNHNIHYAINSQCHKIGSKYYLISFHISTFKLYRVQLKMVNLKKINFVIYDGPGYDFTVLNKNSAKSFIYTSTFQCLIQFLTTYQFQSNNNSILYYSYTSSDNTIYKTFRTHSDIIIQMPFVNCLSNFCVHIVKATEGFQFNFTVLNMSVQSHETSNCMFQGLFLGELDIHHYEAIDEICSDINSFSQSPMLNFHTRGSVLYMVLYWYNGYSSINATVHISVSKCKGIYLDACVYHYYCRNEEHGVFKNFMSTVIHHTNIEFPDCSLFGYKQRFKLPAGECVVLILSNKYFLFKEINNYLFGMKGPCKIHLTPTKSENRISHINGFLEEGNYLEVVSHNSCFSSKQSICEKIFNDRNVSEFHHYRFVNRFKKHLKDEIDILKIKFNSRQFHSSQVNIILTGTDEKGPQPYYGLISHPIRNSISNLLFNVTLQRRSIGGLDWMLTTDRNVKLGPQYKHTKCTFTIKRHLHLISRHVKDWLVLAGRSL